MNVNSFHMKQLTSLSGEVSMVPAIPTSINPAPSEGFKTFLAQIKPITLLHSGKVWPSLQPAIVS